MSKAQNNNSVGDVMMPLLQRTVAGMRVGPEQAGGFLRSWLQ